MKLTVDDDKATDYLKQVLQAWPLPSAIASVTAVNGGLINHTWKVMLMDGSAYILQSLNTTVFKNPWDIAENLKKIGDYLFNKYPSYPFIAPLLTVENTALAMDSEHRYFRLFPFVTGSVSYASVTGPEQAFEAARQFGLFAKLLSGFDATQLEPVLPGFHDLSLRCYQFEISLRQTNEERKARAAGLVTYLISRKDIADKYVQLQHNEGFKKRVMHHDTKISNVLFSDQNEGLCVIDLDTVMAGYFISDAGDMIRTYLTAANEEEKDFSKIVVREDVFAALVQGYFSEMREALSAEEKQHFVYAGKYMVYMQAMRFLTDYLNNDSYYGARYEDHNLVRAGNQTCLLQCIIEKEEILKSIVVKYS